MTRCFPITKSTSRRHTRRAAALRWSAREDRRWSAREDQREAGRFDEQWWTRKRDLDDSKGA